MPSLNHACRGAAILVVMAVCALLPAVARAGVNVSPAHDTATTSTRPVFRWRESATDVDDSCSTIRLSRRYQVDQFRRLTYAPEEEMETADMTYQPYYSWDRLGAGTWWWQVECMTENGGHFVSSAPWRLRVTPVLRDGIVSTQNSYCGSRFFQLRHRWWSNHDRLTIRVVGRQGTRVVADKTQTFQYLEPSTRQEEYVDLNVDSTVKVGSRVYFTSTVTGAGASYVLRTSALRGPC